MVEKMDFLWKNSRGLIFLVILLMSLGGFGTRVLAAQGEGSLITIRKANERGLSKHSWLQSYHTFAFGEYFDAKHKGFHALRVINEDTIQAQKGFDPHPHQNMEIISYVVEGSLEHKDSMGNTTIIRPNEVQRMSAGTGVVHSEYNYEKNKNTHFYQIWIIPKENGVAPSYGQKSFASELKNKKLVLVVSNTGREGSISVGQDVDMYLSRLQKEDKLEYPCQAGRHIWIQVVKGKIGVNDNVVTAGDGLSLSHENLLKIKAQDQSEFMLFDLA